MPRVLYAAALSDLDVSEDLSNPLDLFAGFKLVGSTFLDRFLDEPFVNSIGTIESQFLRSANTVVFAEVDRRDNTVPALEFLRRRVALLGTFLRELWLIRDNSVRFDTLFARSPSAGAFREAHSMSSPTSQITNSIVERQPVLFTKQEILGVSKKMPQDDDEEVLDGRGAGEYVTGGGRVLRARYRIAAARRAPDLGAKISEYCSAFESLFASATDTEGATHKLSERMAWLLRPSPDLRVKMYKEIKEIYNARSRFAHGARVKPGKQTSWIDLSRRADSLARECILRIQDMPREKQSIFEDGSSDDAIDEPLLRVLFGGEV